MRHYNIIRRSIIAWLCSFLVLPLVQGCGEDTGEAVSEYARLIDEADRLVNEAEGDSALALLEKAKTLVTSHRELVEVELKEAQTYYSIGDEIMSKQITRRCMVYFDTMQVISREDVLNKIQTLNLYADLMLLNRNENEALRSHMRIVSLAKEINDVRSFMRSKMFISDEESERGNYMSALEGYLDILPYCEDEDKFKLYTSLQNAYFSIGDALESEKYLKKMREEVDKDDIYGNCVVLFAELGYYNLVGDKEKVVSSVEEMKKYVDIPELSEYYELHIETALADYYMGVDERDSAMVMMGRVMNNNGGQMSDLLLYKQLVMIRWYLYDEQYDMAYKLLMEKCGNIYKRENVNLYNKYMTLLSEYYICMGQTSKAYRVKKNFYLYNDSLTNEAISHNMAYKMLSLRRDTTILSQRVAMARRMESIDRLYYMQSFWIVVVILLLLIAFVSYFAIHMRRLKARYQKMGEMNDTLQYEVMRQTNMLRLQSEELRQKNEGLRSEIIYASKLQQDVLPDESRLDIPCISDHFILHKPCDMISGDFYWIGSMDDKLLLCCGDATGHGIPGTFVAMVCTTILNDQLYMLKDKTPLELIRGLDKNLGIVLQNNEDVHINDSVDLSMLCIDTKTNEVTAVLARHKLYVINSEGQLTSISGVKRSVGDTDVQIVKRDFEEVTVNLQDGDALYMTTDGFESQFGGPSNTKMKRKNMLDKFVEVHNMPMSEQRTVLNKYFDTWKGNNEQTDDVLVIGLRFKLS